MGVVYDFYADIKKEGIMLYDSGEYELHPVGKPNKVKQKKMAEEDFKTWVAKAEYSLQASGMFIAHRQDQLSLNNAAFQLHQAAEALFTAIRLVFTGYRPKTHDLERLLKDAVKCDPGIKEVFTFETAEEKRLFDLLRRAYVDARYRKEYKITEKELGYLAERLMVLQGVANEVCERRIGDF